MTTPTPDRWSAETEELVARAWIDHIDQISAGQEQGTAQLDCTCGGFGRTMVVNADWEPHMVEFRRHRAAAILSSLADAGVLLPAGGETRQVDGWVGDDGLPEPWISYFVGGHVPPSHRRSVTAWPDGSEYVGPWREVTDDPA